jgi:hypothetical protein
MEYTQDSVKRGGGFLEGGRKSRFLIRFFRYLSISSGRKIVMRPQNRLPSGKINYPTANVTDTQTFTS